MRVLAIAKLVTMVSGFDEYYQTIIKESNNIMDIAKWVSEIKQNHMNKLHSITIYLISEVLSIEVF